MLPILSFGRHTLNQIETGITKEWIETNGLGSYAMGTAIGANSRKYHALFVMTSGPDLRRTVMVNRMEESVFVRGKRYDCSCQEYPGSISPRGYLYLETFTFDPFPTWVYSIEDVKIQKQIFLRSGEETAVVLYKNILGAPVRLMLRPFFSCREQSAVLREDEARFRNAVHIDGRRIRCAVENQPAFFTTVSGRNGTPEDGIKIHPESYWYKKLVYAQEEDWEQEYQEDLYNPCQIQADLSPGQELAVVFSAQENLNIEIERWKEQEIFLRKKILENLPVKGSFASRCAIAADQFLIKQKDRSRVLRGYPWHGVALRETLMSLPGLCLATNRWDEARDILRDCAHLLRNGLLPSQFPAREQELPEYRNMDVSLWFVWALQKVWEASKDAEFLKEMKPHVEKIIQCFREGIQVSDPKVQADIRMDADGLVSGYSTSWPLTWMDGRSGDWIASTRRGKPVEIQALWYNALQFCIETALKFDGNDHGLGDLAKHTRGNFNMLFWNTQNNYLYDVIDGNLREGSIRPNALYAISMPYEILDTEKFLPVMETAWRNLYTSLGLRTLSPQEPHFYGIFKGDERTRISATHNGTVYPFLIGPFLTAYFKTYGRETKNKEEALHFLQPFVAHTSDAGLGTISELVDGSTPFVPRGCVASALSVAEILRLMKEEGLEL